MRRFCPGEMSISRIAVHAYDRGYKNGGLFVSWSDTMWTPSLFLTWCLTEGGCHQAGDKLEEPKSLLGSYLCSVDALHFLFERVTENRVVSVSLSRPNSVCSATLSG